MRAIFLIPTLPPPTLGTKVGGWREQIVDFVGRCVVKEVERRPFTSELLSHPLIAEGRAAQRSGVLLRLMETSREPLRAWRPPRVDVHSAARAPPQPADTGRGSVPSGARSPHRLHLLVEQQGGACSPTHHRLHAPHIAVPPRLRRQPPHSGPYEGGGIPVERIPTTEAAFTHIVVGSHD